MKNKQSHIALILTGLVIAAACCLRAEDPSPYVKKRVLILQSTKDYASARKTAEDAAKTLGLKLDLRGLTPHAQTGLTQSKEDCENDGSGVGGEFPCYYARGRYDDGAFISVEYSNAYPGFRPGYYIVVAAIAPLKDPSIVEKTQAKAKSSYPDAYAKTTDVYLGCMH